MAGTFSVPVAGNRSRRDRRIFAVFAVMIGIAVLGYGIKMLPGRGVQGEIMAAPRAFPADGFEGLNEAKLAASPLELTEEATVEAAAKPVSPADQSLRDARKQIRARSYDDALMTLDQARGVLKSNAEAYMLLGRALEGKKDYETARDFYNAALNLDPWLSDAHWGFATTSEALGDLESALGGMRSYLHTEKDPDPERLRINQARSAIWEWETLLGRGPWGPTRGIPPGFVAEDLKRNDKGVGVKWPIEETKQPDGTMKSTIKYAEKIKIYPRP